MGEEFARIEHFAAANGHHAIGVANAVCTTGLHLGLDPLEVVFAAVVVEFCPMAGQAHLLELALAASPERTRRGAAAQQQGPRAQRGDVGDRLVPGPIAPQHEGWGDGVVVKRLQGTQAPAAASSGMAGAESCLRITTCLSSFTSTRAESPSPMRPERNSSASESSSRRITARRKGLAP